MASTDAQQSLPVNHMSGLLHDSVLSPLRVMVMALNND